MIVSVEGFVMQEVPYKENSKIINVFTYQYGMIGIIARGAKSLKSKLRIGTSRLDYSCFEIKYNENKLSTLLDVRVIDDFKNIRLDFKKLTSMYYLLDIAKNVEKNEHNKKIYEIVLSAIKKINEGFNEEVLINIVELKLLDFLGVNPIFNMCSECGSRENIITLSSSCGGLICSKCLKDEYIVNINTIKIIRMLYYVDIDKITKLNISDRVMKEIKSFIKEYYENYTGIYIKDKDYLIYTK